MAIAGGRIENALTQAAVNALLFVVSMVAMVWRKWGPLALIGLGAVVGAAMSLPVKDWF